MFQHDNYVIVNSYFEVTIALCVPRYLANLSNPTGTMSVPSEVARCNWRMRRSPMGILVTGGNTTMMASTRGNSTIWKCYSYDNRHTDDRVLLINKSLSQHDMKNVFGFYGKFKVLVTYLQDSAVLFAASSNVVSHNIFIDILHRQRCSILMLLLFKGCWYMCLLNIIIEM